MIAIAIRPLAVTIEESAISAGNSVPSRRTPKRSMSAPIGRLQGSTKYPFRCSA
jgi:hypothetical protein